MIKEHITNKIIYTQAALALLLLPALAIAQLIEGPRLLEGESSQNTPAAIESESEGWVLVNYMVDRDGNAFEPTIVASVGHESFESQALGMLEHSKFEPANRSGTIVEGSSFNKFIFSTADAPGEVSATFQDELDALSEELENNNRDAAERLIDTMAARNTLNLYEAALLDIARYQFADKFGNSLQKMAYLQSALGYEQFDDNDKFLPAPVAEQARRQLIALQIENKRYAEAVHTYQNLESSGDEAAVERYKSLYDEINEMAQNSSIYSLPGTTDNNGRWSILLHKRSFHVDSMNSKIDELKVRCQGKYVFLPYEEGARNYLPDNWGNCRLEVLGAANVNFELDQF